MKEYRSISVFLSMIISLGALNAQTESIVKSGSIWISPINIDYRAIELPNLDCCVDGKYSFQVDNGYKYIARKDSSICISNLILSKIHLIKIRCNERIVASFRFTFEKEGSSELCLWFNELYCSWSLWPLKNAGHLCKCRSAS